MHVKRTLDLYVKVIEEVLQTRQDRNFQISEADDYLLHRFRLLTPLV